MAHFHHVTPILRKDRDSNPGTPKGLTVFETAPFDHSGIFPMVVIRFAGAKIALFS